MTLTICYGELEDNELSAKQLDNNELFSKLKSIRTLIVDGKFLDALNEIDKLLGEK